MIALKRTIAEALKAAKAAGEIYLDKIILSPLGPAFEAEVAEFAINFATAARSDERTQAAAAVQLSFFFKGEKKFSFIEGEIAAGGALEWVSYTSYSNKFQINVKKAENLYSIIYHKPDELLGVKEASELLGWDPRRVSTYRSRGTFPEPIAELAMGPVWYRWQIEEFAEGYKYEADE
jgi:hypothetical protein